MKTAGFDAKKDALLELAAITLKWMRMAIYNLTKNAIFILNHLRGRILTTTITNDGIDIHNPLRGAVSELDAITGLFQMVRRGTKRCGMSAFYHRGT